MPKRLSSSIIISTLPEYKDPYWINACEATTLVGLACDAPCSSCFCTTAGCGPYHEEGLDVLLVDAADHYLAKILTEKGQKFINTAGWNTAADADAAAGQIETGRQEAEAKITAFVNTDGLKEIDTNELYKAPFWEDVSFSCINCGTCTFVCPTCWCFDIQDENRGQCGHADAQLGQLHVPAVYRAWHRAQSPGNQIAPGAPAFYAQIKILCG